MIPCLLCLFVALSFVAPLLPIVGAASNTMPCCAGKAGHCDSGLAPKKIVRPAEPMCGLDNSEFEDDGITIVAEPSDKVSGTSSSDPAFEHVSVSKPCQMDCGACAASSSRQQKRERGIIQSVSARVPSLISHSSFENQPLSFSSNQDWEQTSPRGPPADLR